ncbi:MAG: hypothetical protein ACXVQU_06030 [Actinomycetota bacterium]
MITSWGVSVEIARDDHEPLTEEAIARLSEMLADDRTVIDRQGSGAVLVRLTIDATSEWGARSAAESKLRAAAGSVWAELALPPFTITFVEVAAEDTD